MTIRKKVNKRKAQYTPSIPEESVYISDEEVDVYADSIYENYQNGTISSKEDVIAGFPNEVHWTDIEDIRDQVKKLVYNDNKEYLQDTSGAEIDPPPIFELLNLMDSVVWDAGTDEPNSFNKTQSQKSAHHLWDSTATADGDVLINRTKAEREDLDTLVFIEEVKALSEDLRNSDNIDIDDLTNRMNLIGSSIDLVDSKWKTQIEGYFREAFNVIDKGFPADAAVMLNDLVYNMEISGSVKKSAHHLWDSTATADGDVLINRTKAEREDLDDFEFAQVKSATILGLWGASMTDSPLFSRVPARSASTFEKVAKDMKASGEVPPKVMSWEKLSTAFGVKRVNDCKNNIQYGMKARMASKELNIPFVMAADLVEDWEKVGSKVLSDVIASVKKEGQTLNLFDNSEYQKYDFQEEMENEEYRNPTSEDEFILLNDFKYEAYFNETDKDFSVILVKGEGPFYTPLEKEEYEFIIDRAARLLEGFSEFSFNNNGLSSFLEDNSLYEDYSDLKFSLSSLYGDKLVWNLNEQDEKSLNTILGSSEVSQITSAKFPARLVAKVREVLASSVPKLAIDQSAADYYKAYYGPYGEQLVKEVKKRVKADLARIWLTKQGVDSAAAEYWSSYYTDQNYGELMSAVPKKRPSVKGMKKAQYIDNLESDLPGEEDWRYSSPAIQVVSTDEAGVHQTEWIQLSNISLEEALSKVNDRSIYDAVGFGEWDNIEDESLNTIMDAVDAIKEFGVEDYIDHVDYV